MAAIAAARRGARVLALDSRPAIGAKILVAGGGRCNVTNRYASAEGYNPEARSFVRDVMSGFSLQDTLDFFEASGVRLKEEEAGKLFPSTDSAQTVLDALTRRLRASGARLRAGEPVRGISAESGRWLVETPAGRHAARAVILCTGGLALPKSGSTGDGYKFASRLGHHVVWTTPALSPLVAEPPVHAGLAGITLPVRLTLTDNDRVLAAARGSFLFTHQGYSGPAALDLSRYVVRERRNHPNACVEACFLPGVPPGGGDAWMKDVVNRFRGRPAFSCLRDLLPRRLADHITDSSGIDGGTPMARLRADDRRRLTDAVTAARLPVARVEGYRKAEATAGGVALDEVDPHTLMSRIAPGLFFAGEVLDVDGRLGGFNFQWAWSSGAVAGRAAAEWAAAGGAG